MTKTIGQRSLASNTGLVKMLVKCSPDTFVLNITTFAKPENVMHSGYKKIHNRIIFKLNKICQLQHFIITSTPIQ
jgi:hypothetical protein